MKIYLDIVEINLIQIQSEDSYKMSAMKSSTVLLQ